MNVQHVAQVTSTYIQYTHLYITLLGSHNKHAGTIASSLCHQSFQIVATLHIARLVYFQHPAEA